VHTNVIEPATSHEIVSDLLVDDLPIPSWAKFHTKLGQQVYTHATKETPVIRLALALPTRSYAAAFVGLGAVLASLDSSSDITSLLANLPSGTAVTVKQGDRNLKGIFLGVEEHDGGLRYIVQIARHGINRYPQSYAKHIQPHDQREVKFRNQQRGRKIAADDFLSHLLGEDEAWYFRQSTQCSSLVVTQKVLFEEEVSQNCLSVKGHEMLQGNLNKLLRVQSSSVTEGYKTAIVAAADDEPSDVDVPFVIFDGARAFLRHHHFYSHRSWVVLLDRCETSFVDGVAQLQQLYLSRQDDWTTFAPPPGVEYMSFVGTL
jgi:hypothetical protein